MKVSLGINRKFIGIGICYDWSAYKYFSIDILCIVFGINFGASKGFREELKRYRVID